MHMGDGQILKRLIRESGMTQEEFARNIGASRGSVVQLTQKAVISEDWKERICTYLKVDKSVFEGKEVYTSGINKDASHILTKEEREALWQIINTQKDIIASLREELRNSKEKE